MAGLALNHLYKRYDNSGKKKKIKNDFAVKDLNLVCEQGEFVALLGPSGCGKTTTLRMIAGLEEITDGEIFIGDRLVNKLHPKDRNIGLAFEDYAMYPPLNVYGNVAFNMRAKGIDKANGIKILCEKLGIDKENAMAIGDSENDWPMLCASGFGIVMGNAPEQMKEKAVAVTLDNEHDGVAYALTTFCEP